MEEVQDHNVHAHHHMNLILYMDNVVNTSLTVNSNNEQNITIQNATVFTKLCTTSQSLFILTPDTYKENLSTEVHKWSHTNGYS
jgi:hypothetical protein